MRYSCLVLVTAAASLKRLEPLQPMVINGAGQCATDGNSFNGCEAWAGYSKYLQTTKPFMEMIYLGVTDTAQKTYDTLGQLQAKIQDYHTNSTTVMYQLGLWFADANGASNAEDVAAGKHDDAIAAYVDAFSNCTFFPEFCKSPLLVRVGFEFNGEWNMYPQEAYKAAFIRIAKAFRANAHTNKYVALAWDYSADAASDRLDWSGWYPGDEVGDCSGHSPHRLCHKLTGPSCTQVGDRPGLLTSS
jgi:hypothetical protein